MAQLDEPFQGNLGPDLSNVGNRLNQAQIKQRIIDPTLINSNTAMPAYGRAENLTQVAQTLQQTPILTEQELALISAYVASLKDP